MQAFFHDGWRHKRVDHELAKATDLTMKRKAAGSRVGERRSDYVSRPSGPDNTAIGVHGGQQAKSQCLAVHVGVQSRTGAGGATGLAATGRDQRRGRVEQLLVPFKQAR